MLLSDDGTLIPSQETKPLNSALPVPPAVIPDNAPGITEFNPGDSGTGDFVLGSQSQSQDTPSFNDGLGTGSPLFPSSGYTGDSMGPLAGPSGFPSAPGIPFTPPQIPSLDTLKGTIGDLFSGLGSTVHGAADAMNQHIQSQSNANDPGDKMIGDIFGNFGALPGDIGNFFNSAKNGPTQQIDPNDNGLGGSIMRGIGAVGNYPVQGIADLATNQDAQGRIGQDVENIWNNRSQNPFTPQGSVGAAADALNTLGNTVFNTDTLHKNFEAAFAPQMGQKDAANLADALAGPVNFAASFMGPQGSVAIATFVANLISNPAQTITSLGDQVGGFPTLVNAFHRWQEGGPAPTGQEIAGGVQAIMVGGMLAHGAHGTLKGIGDRVNYESVKQAGPINEAIARNSTLPSAEDVQARLNNPRLADSAGPDGTPSVAGGPRTPEDIARAFLNKEINSEQVDGLLRQNGISDEQFTQSLMQEHGKPTDIAPQPEPVRQPQQEPEYQSPYDAAPSENYGHPVDEYHVELGQKDVSEQPTDLLQRQVDSLQDTLDHPENWDKLDEGSNFMSAHADQLRDHLAEMKAELESRAGKTPISLGDGMTKEELSGALKEALGFTPEEAYKIFRTDNIDAISRYYKEAGGSQEGASHIKQILDEYQNAPDVRVVGRGSGYNPTIDEAEEAHSSVFSDHFPDGEYGVKESFEPPSPKVGKVPDAVSHELINNIQPTPRLDDIGDNIRTMIYGEPESGPLEEEPGSDWIKRLYTSLDTADPTWVSQYFDLPKSTVSQIEVLLRKFNQEAGLQPGGDMSETKAMNFPSSVVPHEGPAPMPIRANRMQPFAPEGNSLNSWIPTEDDASYNARKAQQSQDRQGMIDKLTPNQPTQRDIDKGELNNRDNWYSSREYQEASTIMADEGAGRSSLDHGDQHRKDVQKGIDSLADALGVTQQTLYTKTGHSEIWTTLDRAISGDPTANIMKAVTNAIDKDRNFVGQDLNEVLSVRRTLDSFYRARVDNPQISPDVSLENGVNEISERHGYVRPELVDSLNKHVDDIYSVLTRDNASPEATKAFFRDIQNRMAEDITRYRREASDADNLVHDNELDPNNEHDQRYLGSMAMWRDRYDNAANVLYDLHERIRKYITDESGFSDSPAHIEKYGLSTDAWAPKKKVEATDVSGIKENLTRNTNVRIIPPHEVDNGWILSDGTGVQMKDFDHAAIVDYAKINHQGDDQSVYDLMLNAGHIRMAKEMGGPFTPSILHFDLGKLDSKTIKKVEEYLTTNILEDNAIPEAITVSELPPAGKDVHYSVYSHQFSMRDFVQNFDLKKTIADAKRGGGHRLFTEAPELKEGANGITNNGQTNSTNQTNPANSANQGRNQGIGESAETRNWWKGSNVTDQRTPYAKEIPIRETSPKPTGAVDLQKKLTDLINRVPTEYREAITKDARTMPGAMNDPLNAFGVGSSRVRNAMATATKNVRLTNPYGLVKWVNMDSNIDSDALYNFNSDGVNVNPLVATPARWVSIMSKMMHQGISEIGDELTPSARANAEQKIEELGNLDDTGLATLHLAHEGFHLAHDVLLSPQSRKATPSVINRYMETLKNLPFDYITNMFDRGMNFGVANSLMSGKHDTITQSRVIDSSARLYELIVNDLLHYHNVPGATFAHQAGMEVYANELANPELKAKGVQILGQHFDKLAAQYHSGKASNETAVAGQSKAASNVGSSTTEYASTSTDSTGPTGDRKSAASNKARLAFLQAHTDQIVNLAKKDVTSWEQFVKDLSAPKTEATRQAADKVLNTLPRKDIIFWKDMASKVAPVATTERRNISEFKNPASRAAEQKPVEPTQSIPDVTQQLGSVGEQGAAMADKAGNPDIGRKVGPGRSIEGQKYPVLPVEVARTLVANLKLHGFIDPTNPNLFFDRVRAGDKNAQDILKRLSPNLRAWVKSSTGLSSQGKAAGEVPVVPVQPKTVETLKKAGVPQAYFPGGIPGRSDDSRFTPPEKKPSTPIAEGKGTESLARLTRSDDSRFGTPEKASVTPKTVDDVLNGIDTANLTPEQKTAVENIRAMAKKAAEQTAQIHELQSRNAPKTFEQRVNEIHANPKHPAQIAAGRVITTRAARDRAIQLGAPDSVRKQTQASYDIAVSRFEDKVANINLEHKTSDPVVDKSLKEVKAKTAKAVEENLTKPVNPEVTPQSNAEQLARAAGFVNWKQVVDIKKGHVQRNYFIEASDGNGRKVGQVVKAPFNLREGGDYSPVTVTGREGFEWTRDQKTGDITIKDPKHLFLGDHKDIWKSLDKDFKSQVNPLFRAGEKPTTPSVGEVAVQHEASREHPFESKIKSPTALTGKEKPNDPKVVEAKRSRETLVADGIVDPLDTHADDFARLAQMTRSDDRRFADEMVEENENLPASQYRRKQAAQAEKASAHQAVRDLHEEAGNDPLGLNKTNPTHTVNAGSPPDEPPPRGPGGNPGDDEFGDPHSGPPNYKSNPFMLKPEEHQAFEKLARGGKEHAKLAAVYKSLIEGYVGLSDPATFEMDGRLRSAVVKSYKDSLMQLADKKTDLMNKLFTPKQRVDVNNARDEIDDHIRNDNIEGLETQSERNLARAEEAYYNVKGRIGEARKIFTKGIEDYYVPRIFKDTPKDEKKIPTSAAAVTGSNGMKIKRKMVDTGAIGADGKPVLRPKYATIRSLEEATGREAYHDAAVTGLLHDKGFIRSWSAGHLIDTLKDTSGFVGNFAGPLVISSRDLQDFRNEDMAPHYRTVNKGEFVPFLRGYHVHNDIADYLERYSDIDNALSHFQGWWKKYKFAMSPFHYVTTVSRVSAFIGAEDPRIKGTAASLTGVNMMRALGVWRRGVKLLNDDPTRVANKIVRLGGMKRDALQNLPDELQNSISFNKSTKNPIGKLNNVMQDALWKKFVYPIQIGLADYLDETRRSAGTSNPAEGTPEELMHWRSIVQQSEAAVMLVPKEELSNTLKNFATALVSRDLTMTQVRAIGRSAMPTAIGKKLFDQSLYNLWETAPWHDIDPKVRDWNIKRTTKLQRGALVHMALGLLVASFAANAVSSAIMNMGGADQPINTPLDNLMDDPIHSLDIYVGKDHSGRRQYLTMPLYAWLTEMVNYPLAAMTAHNNFDADLKGSLVSAGGRMLNKVMPYITLPGELLFNQQLWKLMNGSDAKNAVLDTDTGVARVKKFLDDNHIPDFGGLAQRITYALERMDPLPLPGAQAINNATHDSWPSEVLGGGMGGAIGAQVAGALGERVGYGPYRSDNGLTSQQVYHAEQSYFNDQQTLIGLLTSPSTGDPKMDQANWQIAKGIMMNHPNWTADHIANLIKQQQMKEVTAAQDAQMKNMNPAQAAYIKASRKGYFPGSAVPADSTLYGQTLDPNQYTELQSRVLKNRLDVVNQLSSNQSFQGLSHDEATQQVNDVVHLVDTMTRQSYAQELGMTVGNRIDANEIMPVVQRSIAFRNTALDTVKATDSFNNSSPSEQKAILQRYGTYAQSLLTRQQFGNLKGVDSEALQRMIMNSIDNEESIRSFVKNSAFYQQAEVPEQEKMLIEYSKLAQSMTENAVLRKGQGEFKDQMFNDFNVLPAIQAIVNTEESTKSLLHNQPFYQMSTDAEQKSLDSKYASIAKAIANQDLRKGTSVSNPSGMQNAFQTGNERAISGHLMADAAFSDLQAQFGGSEKIKEYETALADQQKSIGEDANASPKTINYWKNVNRQRFLQQNPQYATYLKARTNWERGTNVGRLYAALNRDETTLAANMVSNIGSGAPVDVGDDMGNQYDAYGNVINSSALETNSLVDEPIALDLAGQPQDSVVY